MMDITVQDGLPDTAAEERYVQALNTCFPGWGGPAMFDWCFRRPGDGCRADLLTLWQGDGLRAGSAITYRRVALRTGATLRAGIMTGSWTLPAARGTGAFTRLIDESRRVARARGAALLLAFVTRHNASCRRLHAAGAALFPTSYCRSGQARPTAITAIAEDSTESIDPTYTEAGCAGFSYTAGEWRGQFLERPGGEVSVWNTPAGPSVVERTAAFDRVHTVSGAIAAFAAAIPALAARASRERRQLFVFTTRAPQADTLRALDFVVVDGYLAALLLDEGAVRAALDAPDTAGATSSRPLADPASPLFLGEWHLQNGDRM